MSEAPDSMWLPEGERRALSPTEIVARLAQLDGWRLSRGGASLAIEKHFKFENFSQAMTFANEVAFIAERQNHHPELTIVWGRCTVRWRTHDVGGISLADIQCAAQVDALAR